MKKNMISMTLISLIGLLVSGVIYCLTKSPILFSCAITFGTMLYHFGIRLMVGHLIDARYHNRMDYTRKWFSEKSFERKLYKLMQVKKWKKRLPTYDPQNFDIKSHSMSEIVQVTCQSEIVHEINMVLSFVPVLFSIWFDSLGVFLITSFAAFLFDSMFVIMQRYNRPRLVRLMKKTNLALRTEDK